MRKRKGMRDERKKMKRDTKKKGMKGEREEGE